VHCEWAEWQAWEDCSASCAGGKRVRRRVPAVLAAFGGHECKGDTMQDQVCGTQPCPIDCAWNIWDEWSDCSQTCGGGFAVRERHVAQEPLYGGKPCTSLGEAMSSPGDFAYGPEVNGVTGRTSEWSRCDNGYTALGLAKLTFFNSEASSHEHDLECSVEENACRVLCKGSDCSFTTRCAILGRSRTVRGSPETRRSRHRKRLRIETSVCPKADTEDETFVPIGLAKLSATGDAVVTQVRCDDSGCFASCHGKGECTVQTLCATGVRVVNGTEGGFQKTKKDLKRKQTDFGDSSTCPRNAVVAGFTKLTCGWGWGTSPSGWHCDEKGCESRCSPTSRKSSIIARCLVLEQSAAGFLERKVCGNRPCPVDCVYADWEAWGHCSKSCETGRKSRIRLVQVEAAHDGKSCASMGPAVEHEVCEAQPCPVDCVWSDWGEFEDCSVSCSSGSGDQGKRSRRRLVARAARYDGQPCEGPFEEEAVCSTHACPVDCVYGLWQAWSGCTTGLSMGSLPVTCGGGGSRQRSRPVLQQVLHGGQQCRGSTIEVDRSCASSPCPVDCKLDVWTEWSACSKDCGPGLKSRFRTPSQPALYHGKPCEGKTQEVTSCQMKTCGEGEGTEQGEGEQAGGGSSALTEQESVVETHNGKTHAERKQISRHKRHSA